MDMKQKIITYLIIISGMALLAGCSDSGKTYKIGVSQCSEGRWREKVNQEMLAAQHLYEDDVEVAIVRSYDDTQLQIRQIDSLANSGIDLLVVAPNESAPVAQAVARVRQKGIPVILFDRKTSTDDYTAFIGGNNVEASKTVGDYVLGLREAGQRLYVLEITGSMKTSPAQERHKGFAEAMKGHEGVEYVCQEGDWTSDKAYRIAKEMIEKKLSADKRQTVGSSDLIVAFCHNDGMATGVYKAVVETKTEGQIKILGIDGMPGEGIEYVQFGHQVGSYVYPTHGEKIVRLALDILTGKPYERDNTLQGMMVTPGNCDLLALNAKELMQQNDDLITIQNKLENSLGLYKTQHKALIGSIVAIVLLVVAVLLIWRALVQTRKAVRKQQALNEEQTLFYTDASSRKLHDIFDKPDSDLPPPRSQDMIFAEQLNEAIRKHLSNANLKMDDLGDEMGLSRVQLYRKVKAATGQTPVELLRQMRLQRAYALLTSTNKTVQEIAYEVGFGTPGYFSKCFKQQYGKYPMDLRTE